MTQIQALRQIVLSRLLVAFESQPFRRIWFSTLFNSTGSWMIRLAVGWLVLDLTNSAVWVGVVAALEGAGELAFGLVSGVLVDRFDGRKLLIVAYVIGGAVALVVGLLVVGGWIAPWHLLIAAVIRGALMSVQSTASSAIIFKAVGAERVMNATATKMLCFNLARVGGSALAGAIIVTAGVGPSYLAAGAIICAAVLPLLALGGSFRTAAAPPGAVWRAAGEGIRYVWSHPHVRPLWALSAVVETFAFSYTTMVPVIARDVLRVDAAGLGTLSAAGGVGAIVGTLLTLSLSHVRRKADLLLAGAGAAGLALVLFGLSRSFPLSMLLLALVSLALVVYDVLMNTLMLLLADEAMRGRVLSLYSLTFGLGSGGGVLAGAVAASLGAAVAVAACGGVVLAYLAGAFKSLRQVRVIESDAPV